MLKEAEDMKEKYEKLKKKIEAENDLENIIYSAKSSMEDNGDKLEADGNGT